MTVPDDPVNREWILSELRALRDMVATEQSHVSQRFEQVNELRRQVLEERGMFPRHELLNALTDRINRLEQTFINRDDHERLAERVFSIEKTGINRPDFDRILTRVGKLESFGPIVALVAGVMGAAIGALVVKYFAA